MKWRSKNSLKSKILTIKTKVSKIRYVIDGWKLHNFNQNRNGFSLMVGIVDYFSKFILSYTIVNNNAKNILNSLTQFAFSFGIFEILQSDNGSEYKNDIISNFLYRK